ncbi:MAG: nitrilase [Methanomicrobiales archaeon]|nr:nitrilase [Methanomicrobiales archaeon]
MAFTLALAQMSGAWGDPATTLRTAEKFIRRAAEAGAGLLCFPEQFATGWSPRVPRFAETLGGPITRELGRLAAEYAVPLLGSFVEATLDRPRNTCVVFDREGNALASYAKIHLFTPAGEDRNYTPGEALATFTLEGVHFGIAICYDLRFAPLFHLYALQGVDCMIVPAAWPCRRIGQWELLVATRALESQCYVAGVNRIGVTPVEEYCGHSLIASPTGTILARAGDDEAMICAEIDIALPQEVREALPVRQEYRPDLYTRLYGERR